MATVSVSNQSTKPRSDALSGYPEGGLRFDWTMVALAALFLGGLWVDGWAHFHGRTDDSFFTPWHFLFYGSFGVVALFLGYHQLKNAAKGYTFARALPKGYALSLIGVGVFAVSGAGDMIWHTLFGIEGGTEALMSPTHIGLAIGMSLIMTGPARAAWLRLSDSGQRGWVALGALIISVTLFLSLIMFFTSYANPIVSPATYSGNQSLQDAGVTGILLTTALLSGIVALLSWNWRLPFGAFTVIFTLSTALLTILNDFYVLGLGALVAGVIIDLVYVLLRPSAARTGRFIAFTFLAPVIYFAAYFVTVTTVEPVRWSIHVWTGSIFIAGIIGLLAAVLVTSTAHAPQPNTNVP